MPRRAAITPRLATALRWPVGVGLTSWSYMWRTTPMHRREEPGSQDDHPPPIPRDADAAGVQRPEDGVGALFRRRYAMRIRDTPLSAAGLMERLQADPDRAAPSALASFHKVHGDPGSMRVGDEYVVRMPGPWDGPVRVIATSPCSFRLATLRGHLEAGQIEFRAADADGELRFEIESWARSATRLCDLLYDRLRMSKEVQLHMWTSFAERVVRLAGGRMVGGIAIHTRRASPDGP